MSLCDVHDVTLNVHAHAARRHRLAVDHLLVQRLTADDGREAAVGAKALLIVPGGSAVNFSQHAVSRCSLIAIEATALFPCISAQFCASAKSRCSFCDPKLRPVAESALCRNRDSPALPAHCAGPRRRLGRRPHGASGFPRRQADLCLAAQRRSVRDGEADARSAGDVHRRSSRRLQPEAGAWGRSGCTRVVLTAVDEDTLGEALTLAWRNTRKTTRKKCR